MTLICGTDDAGRGPVIGPMVIAGVLIEEERIPSLTALGIKDSKQLTPKKREELFEKIIKLVKHYKIIIIPAGEIDQAILSPGTNLNWLEGIKFTMVINALKPNVAIIDCPSTNTKAFKDFLSTYLKCETNLQCEHKADEKYVIVGAASILAKVTRDREIEKLKETYGDFGSGYPADPKTVEFLKDKWDKHPELFRHSWAPYKEVSQKKKQMNLGEF